MPEMTRENNRSDNLKFFGASFLGISVINLLVYGPSLTFNFLVRSDDQAYIFRNPYLQNWSLDNLLAIFSHVHFDSYLPVTLASFSLDYTFWQFDPFGYHLTQLVLHTVNVFLALVLLMQIGVSRGATLAVALVYAVHPIQTESVVWISERKNLLSAFFIFSSFLFYIQHTRETSRFSKWLGVSWTLFVLGLLSKSVTVMLPLVFVLYDICLARRGLRLMEKIPFFAGSLAVAAATVVTQGAVEAIREYAGGSFTMSFLYTLRVYWDYLESLGFPFFLSPQYFYRAGDLHAWRSLLADALVPSLVLAGLWNIRKRPYFAFGVGWFVLWLLPVSNLVPIQTLRQDRYLYLPSLAIFSSVLIPVLSARRMRQYAAFPLILTGLLVILLGSQTGKYSTVFASSRAYWLHVAKAYPPWSQAQFEAGYQCWLVKDEACSIRFYNRAIQADPQNALALNNLGALMIDQGRYGEARTYVEKSLKADPGLANAYRNLIIIAKKTGKDLDRIPEWQRKYEGIRASVTKRDYRLGKFRFR